ncbi:helix-turn-helix transcriptional regulator [Corynebacterium rhinophilum]|uniref:helix-turn-helix transcriptional regulator n=1 Tax=Corynebacterium rhinophilum TaxID=3050197 RepID=UPI00254F8802|nr:helix-turn-helix domain-containing protein [Corynebacterium sp. MSK192]MDK8698425.1 helix-turn-helix domain-containing protein [Corynebacterium sp. MSK192]
MAVGASERSAPSHNKRAPCSSSAQGPKNPPNYKEDILKTTKQSYSVPEVARMLGISQSTLYEHVKQNTVPHLHPITVGARTVFPKRVIDALFDPKKTA